jgi:putative hemolysin
MAGGGTRLQPAGARIRWNRHAAGGHGIQTPSAVDNTDVFSLSRTEHAHLPPSFSASEWFDGTPARAWFAPLARVVDRLLALPAFERLYRAVPKDERAFWDRALATLEIDYDVAAREAAYIPATGPLIVAANHPHGALDGLVLASLVTRVRPDLRLVGNDLLARIPELGRSLLAVDVLGRRPSMAQNASAMRRTVQWLKDGGAVLMFPAGEVSHRRRGEVADSAWSSSVARLADRAGASVVPAFVAGGNSALFHAAGRVHPRLRTALLVRELLAQRGRCVRLRVGRAIPPARLASFTNAEAATEYIRLRVYAFGDDVGGRTAARTATPPADASRLAPLAPPESLDVMAREVAALPAEKILLTSGAYKLCLASACEIPATLREIGRLREIAFRAVGEGSGLGRDIDAFDQSYLHLVLWNVHRCEVVGAYRIGQTDEILRTHGVGGLYTSTLFRYERRLLDEMGPALELGRAFVRQEYQKDYSPLLLLWRGIGAFVARNPRYRRLFGTVSISRDYQSLSQQILARFLYATSYRDDLAPLVEPRNPPPFLRDGRGAPAILRSVARTVADVGALVAEIEADGKGVPVLLRQYLKLNARLLGFNVDPAFGGVLDGLMMVDLKEVDRELLVRYLGRDGAVHFLTP